MDLADEYVLLAPDEGNPVDFQAEYHVIAQFTRGTSGGGSTFQAYFRTADENGPNFFKRVFATTATDTVLIWPLRLRPGVPFVIYGSLLVDALKGTNEVEVRFKFTHLPTGAVISSCQGFLTEQPVPAIERTWGRLRATYR